MRRLYLIVPGPELTRQVVTELAQGGLPAEALRVYSPRPGRLADLPAAVAGLGPSNRALVLRALAGAGIALAAGLILLALGLAVPGLWWLLGGALAGAAAGAALLPWGHRPEGLKRMLGPGLRRGDVALLVDLPDSRLGEVEDGIKSRHPEVRVRGTDPTGSPAFP